MGSFNYENVKNPEFFKEGVLPAHSDHRAYGSDDELSLIHI